MNKDRTEGELLPDACAFFSSRRTAGPGAFPNDELPSGGGRGRRVIARTGFYAVTRLVSFHERMTGSVASCSYPSELKLAVPKIQ